MKRTVFRKESATGRRAQQERPDGRTPRVPGPNPISRRRFNRSAVAASTPLIISSHVLGLAGAKPPSEKLNIAGIGIGGQGADDLAKLESENIVALCDVDAAYAAGTFQRYPKAKSYTDYRKMLEGQKDIDAIVIATPDHLHACIAMASMEMGKHVYCEKPLTHSVWEARQLAQAAREHKVATQMGNQGQASEATRRLCEMIWDGAIVGRPQPALHEFGSREQFSQARISGGMDIVK